MSYTETEIVAALQNAANAPVGWDVSIIRGMLAEAWDEGRAAEHRDWEFVLDLTTPDEDRQPLPNPYRLKRDYELRG